MSFVQIVRARPALYKISRFIVAIDCIRNLPLIICMIVNIHESRDDRNNPRSCDASGHAHRGDEDAGPRSHVSTGIVSVHVYRRCVLSFHHVSHSRGFYTDICPTRGCKWVRPTYETISKFSW